MKLILHIGTAKTGTTVLQHALWEHRECLQRQGVWFCRSAGQGNARRLPAAFMESSREDDFTRGSGLDNSGVRKAFTTDTLQALRVEVDQAVKANCNTFVISSEHFQSRLETVEEVARCADWFCPLFQSVQVVVYLRRQDQAAVSRHSERLRAGWVEIEPLAECNTIARGQAPSSFFDYYALLDRWASAFGDAAVTPCVYDRCAMTDGSIVSDFWSRFGLSAVSPLSPVAPLASGFRDNTRPALPALAQASLFLFNQDMGESRRFDPEVKSVRDALWPKLAELTTGAPLMPSRASAMAFMGHFQAMNTAIAERWFPSPSGTDTAVSKATRHLFSEDYSMYPDVADTPDWDAARTLLNQAMTAISASPAP